MSKHRKLNTLTFNVQRANNQHDNNVIKTTTITTTTKAKQKHKQYETIYPSTARRRHAILLAFGTLFLILLKLNSASASEGLSTSESPPPPKMHELEAEISKHVVFNCHIDFPYDYQIPYVLTWTKDDKKIFTQYEGDISINNLFHGRLKLVSNHRDYGKASLNLTAIRESDSGKYHCQIRFPYRTPSIRNNGTWYRLTVIGSLIKIPPVNQTIMEGQAAIFPCVMKHAGSEVKWYRDGMLLQDVQDLAKRCSIDKEGNLSIEPTMMSDLGEYECHVQNTEGETQIAKAFLNIQYKAKVIYAPPEVYLPYGQPAVLDCHFRANPPLQNLRWEKDGLLFDSYNVPGVYYKMNGSLFFAKVNENHAGSYTCTPFNDLGTDGPSPVISVIVLRPPIFTVTPKAIYIQKLGDTVQFACEAIDRDGNNKPAIVWTRRDGRQLPPERIFQQGGNLTIMHLTENDRGMYECSATNEAATVSAETELMIENLTPRPPYNLTANSTETAITVRWQPGYLRPNLEYTVWYRLTDAPEWRTLRIIQKNTMEATIHHLLPGREYEFMVLSQDKYGDGMFSKQFRFATQPESKTNEVGSEANPQHNSNDNNTTSSNEVNQEHLVKPLGASQNQPWNLNVIRNQQGWLMHWEQPEPGFENLRLYSVNWWKEPEHFLIGTAETFDNFYQLRQLKEDSLYIVQVVALLDDGTKVASNEFALEIPSQRRLRALIIGSSVAVIFLLCALCAFLYMKRSCLKHLIAPKVVLDDSDVVGVVGASGAGGSRSSHSHSHSHRHGDTEASADETGDDSGDSENERELQKVHVT